MNIRYALLAFVFFISVCSFLFTSFYEKAKQESIKNLNTEQLLYARQAARGIEDFFTNWTKILTTLSETNHIKNMDATGKKDIENLYKDNKESIRAVTRVNARGRIIYTIPYDRSAIGRDISSQKHVREIMETHKPVISDVFFAVQGYSTIALQVPVFKDKTYQGTIGINVNFQPLAKRYLEVIKIGTTGYAWVTSRDGTELFCPIPGHVGNSVYENCKDFPSILAMAGDMLKGHEGVTTYTFDKVRGDAMDVVKKHAVYMPITIGNTFWSIVVASSEDEVLSSLKGFRNRLIVIIGILLLGGVLFSYYSMKAWGIVHEEERRRIAEGELRESERRLTDIINFLPDATLAIDQKGRIITWNKAIEEMTGFPAETMLGKGDYEYAIPFYGTRRPILINFVTMWDQDIEKQYSFIKKEGDTLFTETNVPFVRGQNRILWGKAGPLYDTHGNVVGAIESIHDITERKQSEETLFNEKEKLLILSENAPFGMTLIDKSGQFLYINPKYRDIFGYDLCDITDGKTWFKKAYPDEAYRHNVISTWLDDLNNAGYGEQRPRVFNVTCKDGSVKVINFIPVLLGNGDNMMVCEDITDRKLAEEQIKTSLKEKEVLLREVHHRVKNNMQVISSLLHMQSRYLTDTKAIDVFMACMNRIRSMALIHNKLYQSEGLSHIDICDYVQDLSRNLLSTCLVDTRIELNLDIDPLSLTIDTVMPLGLLINELLTNSLKHAFPEKMFNVRGSTFEVREPAKITITLKEKQDQETLASVPGISPLPQDSEHRTLNVEHRTLAKQVTLTISDNGIGIPPDLDYMNTESMGMQLVITLVEQLEGTIELNRDQGTEFRITFSIA